jgi:hypothetical protein
MIKFFIKLGNNICQEYYVKRHYEKCHKEKYDILCKLKSALKHKEISVRLNEMNNQLNQVFVFAILIAGILNPFTVGQCI